jgi:pentatricopeptide repeat protein
MPSSDWDLGQKLIERGCCTLDQVREALSIQDQMKRMGIVPKPLVQILAEKGYVRPEQLAEFGLAVPPAPRGPRPAARALPRRRPFPVVPVLLVLAVAGVGLAIALRPAPAGGPAPPRPSPAEAAAALEREAAEELDRIEAFQNSARDFENAPEVVQRYAAYQRKHAGRKWELEADGRLKEYRARADAFARPELEAILKRDPELREQGRWGDLLGLYRKFPARYLSLTDSGRVVRERVAELSLRVRESYLREKAEVEKLLAERKFEEAQERARALEAAAPEESLAEASDLRARVEREWKVTTAKVRQEVADKYLKEIDGPYREALARRDARGAAGLVAKFLYAPWGEDARPFVRVKAADYGALKEALDGWKPESLVALCEAAAPDVDSPDRLTTGEAALLDLRNAALVALFLQDQAAGYQKVVASREKLDLPTLGKGHFERQGDRTVFVGEGGGLIGTPLQERDFVYLAMRAGAPEAAAHARAGFFYYLACRDHFIPAFEHLSKARELGARGIHVYLASLVGSVQVELARQLRTKFGAARDSFEKRQWPTARKLLGEVLEHGDHPFTRAMRPEIEKMLFDIAEGTEREKALAVRFKAKVEPAEGGAVRVTYDFEGKEQVDAFEFVTEEGGRRFKGRWRFDRGVAESSPEASVMVWKTPVKGDVAVEYDLAPLEDPQNIALNLYYNRGQARHYSVVFGFDWVGKADGDTTNTAEDKFGMPRTAVIKYPVSVDKSRWVLADHWENWTSRLVGKGAGTWMPPKGKSTRVRVAREGNAIRLYANGALLSEGEDPDYAQGSLLFFSDCRCRLDNLSITLQP